MSDKCFALLLTILVISLPACTPKQPATSDATQAKPIPKRLVFNSVILDGTQKMFTVLADVNSDSKLDLVLGTTGHVYFPNSPNIRVQQKAGNGYADLAIHLNNSQSDSVSFAEPYLPKGSGEESKLPMG